MSTFEDPTTTLVNFSGQVRLFPLPNLVMFPHVLQPLHIFEPRYRELMEEALSDDQLIAMAMLRPGWEDDYDGRPPVYPYACLARVTSHCRLKSGSYNLLLLGVQRVRLVHELSPDKSFREAKVDLCADVYPAHKLQEIPLLQDQLRQAMLTVLPQLPQAQDQLDQLLAADVPLGVLADIVSFMIDVSVRDKARLLAEVNVHRRARLLLKHLATTAGQSVAESMSLCFPPLFSSN